MVVMSPVAESVVCVGVRDLVYSACIGATTACVRCLWYS